MVTGKVNNPYWMFYRYLEWLESHDGRLYRIEQGGKEDDYDAIGLIPTPPGRAIFTVGDLRIVVKALQDHGDTGGQY